MQNLNSNELSFLNYDEKYATNCHKNFLSHEETAKYTLWKMTNNKDDAKIKLNYWTSSLGEKDIFWLIKENKSGEIIGFICVSEIEPNIYGDVGIAIGLDFVRKGYGKISLNALIQQIKMQGESSAIVGPRICFKLYCKVHVLYMSVFYY